MNTPPLSNGSLREQAHTATNSEDSRRGSLTLATWFATLPETWQQELQFGTNERSPGCGTTASIGYPEVDSLPSRQSLSNQEPLKVAPTSPSGAAANKDTLKSSAGDSSMSTPTTAAPVSGSVPSSNAASHYKTKRCRHFDQSGWCPYQHRCVFAHGDREFALYTAQKNSGSGANSEDGSPATSKLVREHIERNVQQLVEEYELAVAEASAKAAARNNTGGPYHAHGHRGPQIGNGSKGSTPIDLHVAFSELSRQRLSAAQHQAANVHVLTAGPLTPASVVTINGATNSMAQLQTLQPQSPHQCQAHQQQYAIVGQQPVLISRVNGVPAGSAVAMVPSSSPMAIAPPSVHALPSHYQQPPMLFSMQTGAPNVFQLHQQQPVYLIETPSYNAVAVNGSNIALPAYPAGYTTSSHGIFNDASTARFM
ncbi:hypothetical protein, unknown function [Leishmania tarentolae]|uniref:C3H1-type domain-containing protein n=1 Tax=Leishmania tarentolae TaxID=5689 RepID=A0A640KS76_LEITA|nr:hypothetical protein, unknown function [Leishmania tarentolae]